VVARSSGIVAGLGAAVAGTLLWVSTALAASPEPSSAPPVVGEVVGFAPPALGIVGVVGGIVVVVALGLLARRRWPEP
jgi:hypothetical protein